MWAEVELNNEIQNFINQSKNHIETFDEIKELVFTRERLSKNCSTIEMFNLSLQFQKIKNSAFDKVLKHQKLNFPEGFVFERLLNKYFSEENISVEEHIQRIKLSCGTNRQEKRKAEKNIATLYNNFINKVFHNSK